MFALLLALSSPVYAVPAPKPDPARATIAAQVFEQARNNYIAGTGSLEEVYQWSLRWADAVGGAAAWTAHHARMVELSGQVAAKVQKGMGPVEELTRVSFYVAEAKSWL